MDEAHRIWNPYNYSFQFKFIPATQEVEDLMQIRDYAGLTRHCEWEPNGLIYSSDRFEVDKSAFNQECKVTFRVHGRSLHGDVGRWTLVQSAFRFGTVQLPRGTGDLLPVSPGRQNKEVSKANRSWSTVQGKTLTVGKIDFFADAPVDGSTSTGLSRISKV